MKGRRTTLGAFRKQVCVNSVDVDLIPGGRGQHHLCHHQCQVLHTRKAKEQKMCDLP